MMTLKRFLTSGTVALLLAVQAFAGTVTGVQQNAQGGPVANGTYTFQLTAPATIAGVASIATSTVNCYTDASGNVVGEPNPLVLPITSVNLSSGTLAAGNYFVKIWYFDGSGNSFPSPEVSVNLASPGTLTILSPIKQPANASGYRVGISTVSGSETLQGSVTGTPGSWGNFSQSTALVAGSAAPVSNSTACSLHFNDEMTPSFVCYNVGLTYGANGTSVPGYPQYWYLAGGANGIVNIANGTPQANVCAQQGIFYPQAILALPPFGSPQSIGGPLNIGGALAVPQINKRIYVDGSTYPVTQAGIQQAFTDACAVGNGTGTEVNLPAATNVTLTNTTTSQFTITCPLHVRGPISGSFWFIVGNSVPNTVPLFLIKPSGANLGYFEFDHFRITSGGAVGGSPFFLDSTSGGVNALRIHDIASQGQDVSKSFLDMNSAGGFDQYFLGHIWDNQIEGGINMNSTSTADSWLIEHNSFGGTAGNTTPCLNATTEAGSAHITAFNNNGGCLGGFFISHGTTQCKILYNQIEQPGNSTEANSAIIDLIGDTYSIDGCEIVGNNLNAHTFVTRNIRLGAATNTHIEGNVIVVKATTGIGIDLDAGLATLTRIPWNEFIGTGGGALAIKNSFNVTNFGERSSDGSATAPAYSFAGNTDRGWFNVAGSGLVEAFAGLDIRLVNGGGDIVGSAMGRCWGSAVDPLSGAFDTCISRTAAGTVSADTTTVGNSLGTFKGAGQNISGNSTLKRVIVVGTAPSCAVTGAGAGATCSIVTGSTDMVGQMNINTGTGPSANGTITLTYSSTYGTNNTNCAANLTNGGQAWNARATGIGGGGTTSSVAWLWDNNAVTLTASQAGGYAVSYWCGGR